jgi:hypothetical protein
MYLYFSCWIWHPNSFRTHHPNMFDALWLFCFIGFHSLEILGVQVLWSFGCDLPCLDSDWNNQNGQIQISPSALDSLSLYHVL